jgi:hypothetical protein
MKKSQDVATVDTEWFYNAHSWAEYIKFVQSPNQIIAPYEELIRPRAHKKIITE